MNNTQQNTEKLIETLKSRFQENLTRHPKLDWSKIEKKLATNQKALSTLFNMEQTGGEPDVVDYDPKTNIYTFCDCSEESPKGRRSLCYDQNALDSRKEFKPKDSAENMAKNIGGGLLTEDEYRHLQTVGEFDQKTSSWIKTPEKIRKLGGAIFADRRYDTVFIYHNGAESYYASRGFRCQIKV